MDKIYVRVSKKEQNEENQIKAMSAKYPDAEIIREKMSSLKERPKLNKLLASLKAGDRLIVWKLDRLGRGQRELVNTIHNLEERNITFISDQEGDFSTMQGKAYLGMLSTFAEMERNNTSERTKIGLVVAKAKRAKKIEETGVDPWKSRKPKPGVRPGGKRPIPRDPAMIEMIRDLRNGGKTWSTIVMAINYQNANWKVGVTTAAKLYAYGDGC